MSELTEERNFFLKRKKNFMKCARNMPMCLDYLSQKTEKEYAIYLFCENFNEFLKICVAHIISSIIM